MATITLARHWAVLQFQSPLPHNQLATIFLHQAQFSTCQLAFRKGRNVLTVHMAETRNVEKTRFSTVGSAVTTPHCASLVLGTAQIASGSGTNISCNIQLALYNYLWHSFHFPPTLPPPTSHLHQLPMSLSNPLPFTFCYPLTIFPLTNLSLPYFCSPFCVLWCHAFAPSAIACVL